jgi:ElaB/YqjD/DUF883 family membrane-anchored ribosome-binding protein
MSYSGYRSFSDRLVTLCYLQSIGTAGAPLAFFFCRGRAMNGETSQTPFPTSAENSQGGLTGNGSDTVHRLAQRVHEAVDTLEQRIGQSSERVMTMQQEYGDMARDQVRANPLAAVGVAFAAGFLFAKLFR